MSKLRYIWWMIQDVGWVTWMDLAEYSLAIALIMSVFVITSQGPKADAQQESIAREVQGERLRQVERRLDSLETWKGEHEHFVAAAQVGIATQMSEIKAIQDTDHKLVIAIAVALAGTLLMTFVKTLLMYVKPPRRRRAD